MNNQAKFFRRLGLRVRKGRKGLDIGPAGWAYADWSGVVYPKYRLRDFHEATCVAGHFDMIEINTSFYPPRRPSMNNLNMLKGKHLHLNS